MKVLARGALISAAALALVLAAEVSPGLANVAATQRFPAVASVPTLFAGRRWRWCTRP